MKMRCWFIAVSHGAVDGVKGLETLFCRRNRSKCQQQDFVVIRRGRILALCADFDHSSHLAGVVDSMNRSVG